MCWPVRSAGRPWQSWQDTNSLLTLTERLVENTLLPFLVWKGLTAVPATYMQMQSVGECADTAQSYRLATAGRVLLVQKWVLIAAIQGRNTVRQRTRGVATYRWSWRRRAAAAALAAGRPAQHTRGVSVTMPPRLLHNLPRQPTELHQALRNNAVGRTATAQQLHAHTNHPSKSTCAGPAGRWLPTLVA